MDLAFSDIKQIVDDLAETRTMLAEEQQLTSTLQAKLEKANELSTAISDAVFYLGGGDLYLEEFGRLCFCTGCMFTEKGTRDKKIHASTCEDLWRAWKAHNHHTLKVTK
jgi:hypothetical protein